MLRVDLDVAIRADYEHGRLGQLAGEEAQEQKRRQLADDGHPRFHRPDGTLVDPAPTIAIDLDDGGIERRNDHHGIEIDADTITTNWCGDPLDVGIATDNLMWSRRRRKRDAA